MNCYIGSITFTSDVEINILGNMVRYAGEMYFAGFPSRKFIQRSLSEGPWTELTRCYEKTPVFPFLRAV